MIKFIKKLITKPEKPTLDDHVKQGVIRNAPYARKRGSHLALERKKRIENNLKHIPREVNHIRSISMGSGL